MPQLGISMRPPIDSAERIHDRLCAAFQCRHRTHLLASCLLPMLDRAPCLPAIAMGTPEGSAAARLHASEARLRRRKLPCLEKALELEELLALPPGIVLPHAL